MCHWDGQQLQLLGQSSNPRLADGLRCQGVLRNSLRLRSGPTAGAGLGRHRHRQSAICTIDAVSQDGSTIDAVGTGTTDDTGTVIAPIDATGLQSDTAYQATNSLAVNLAVQPADAQDSGGGAQDLMSDGFYSEEADGALQRGVNVTEALPAGELECNASENPSQYTAAMASACGDEVYPLSQTVTQYSDGQSSEVDYVDLEQGPKWVRSSPHRGSTLLPRVPTNWTRWDTPRHPRRPTPLPSQRGRTRSRTPTTALRRSMPSPTARCRPPTSGLYRNFNACTHGWTRETAVSRPCAGRVTS